MDDEALPFFICTFDVGNLRFLHVSESFAQRLGYRREDLEGHYFSDFVLRGDILDSIEVVNNNLREGDGVEHHTNHYRHHTRPEALAVTWFAEKPRNGKCLCIGIPGQTTPLP